jgi:hypothetical protein
LFPSLALIYSHRFVKSNFDARRFVWYGTSVRRS